MHTAGITTSFYSEQQMVAMEATDLERSKARKIMPVQDVIRFYDFEALFQCPALTSLNILYYDSELVAHFLQEGNTTDVLQDLWVRMVQGFRKKGREVQVTLLRSTQTS